MSLNLQFRIILVLLCLIYLTGCGGGGCDRECIAEQENQHYSDREPSQLEPSFPSQPIVKEREES